MDKAELTELLNNVHEHKMSVEDAVLRLKRAPFADIDFACLDLHRGIRNGAGEVVYGEGKSAEQIIGIIKKLRECGQKSVLISRLSAEKAAKVSQVTEIKYFKTARTAVAGEMKKPDGNGKIVIACAGTSDLPVAEEARITAEFLGNETVLLCNVGVAGLHRLLSKLDVLMSARVVVSIAGMEGALASVIGGLAECPVIAVPTSVGYGASYGGISALLAMLNSCASGVSVVNIDNGFGAAYQASLINHLETVR